MTRSTSNFARANPRRGFTLIELLVVMGLIVILITIALPTFRFMSGSRSVEGASNVISAALANSRADAIGIQKIRGIMLFRDPVTDRTAISFLESKDIADWAAGGTYTTSMYVRLGANNPYDFYVCLADNTATTTNKPGSAGGAGFWRAVPSAKNYLNNGVTLIDSVLNSDRPLLPSGIGFAGVVNTGGYVDASVILFDAYGTVVSRDYIIPQEGLLGSQVPFTTAYPGTSQIAMMVYDKEGLTTATSLGTAVDAWLNENGTSLLVNRYNGTIVRGE